MKGKTGKCILLGAGITVVMAFPVAGLLALVYRFPVPFAGYVSGFSAVGYAMVGVVIYGLLGGFPLLALLGGLAGAVAARRMDSGEGKLQWKWLLLPSLIIDLAALFCLAILDKIIGPW
jgi:hypothetical protein